jgi:tetratricopeptide (TPR) repeat protein
MFHKEWLEQVEIALREIETRFPHCPVSERPKWRKRFLQIQESCNQLLQAWVTLEERIAGLLSEHPDLCSEEVETGEEFWMSESTVRRFRQGQGYYWLTMYKEAGGLFKSLVEQEPDFLLGRVYLGLTLFQSGRLDEARSHFHLVAETAGADPFVSFARHMLGCIAVKEGDDRKAIREFSKAAALQPDYADSWFNLGACHYRLGEYHEAIPCFYHALSLDEDDWEAMYYLSGCYRHANEWQSVTFWRLASYEKANHPRILESIAHDWEEMGNPKEAIKWYRRLLEADPRHPGAYHGLAWNLWATGRTAEAFAWIKKGLSLIPRHPDLLFTFIWLSMASGDMDRAEAALGHLTEQMEEEPIWLAVRSRLLTHMGDFKQAMQAADRLTSLEKPEFQAMGYYQKGRILLEAGDPGSASGHFRVARRLAPDWQDPLFFEGICHLIEGRPDAMRECLGQMALLK